MKIARVLASVAAILAGVLPVRLLTTWESLQRFAVSVDSGDHRGSGGNPQPARENAKHSFTIEPDDTGSVTPNAPLASSLQTCSRGL